MALGNLNTFFTLMFASCFVFVLNCTGDYAMHTGLQVALSIPVCSLRFFVVWSTYTLLRLIPCSELAPMQLYFYKGSARSMAAFTPTSLACHLVMAPPSPECHDKMVCQVSPDTNVVFHTSVSYNVIQNGVSWMFQHLSINVRHWLPNLGHLCDIEKENNTWHSWSSLICVIGFKSARHGMNLVALPKYKVLTRPCKGPSPPPTAPFSVNAGDLGKKSNCSLQHVPF